MNEHPQPTCQTSDHGQALEIYTTKPHSERSGQSSTVNAKRRLSVAGRVGLRRPFLSVLACAATLLGVSACGSSTPRVSQALKSKLESALETIPLTPAKAKEVTDCLVPALKDHGIVTLAAAKAYGNSVPPSLRSAELACVKQAGLESGNTGSAATSSSLQCHGYRASRRPGVQESPAGIRDVRCRSEPDKCGGLRSSRLTERNHDPDAVERIRDAERRPRGGAERIQRPNGTVR